MVLTDWRGNKEGAYDDFDKEVVCVACEDWKFPNAEHSWYLKKPKKA